MKIVTNQTLDMHSLILLNAIILLSTFHLNAQNTQAPLKKRAEDAAKKYLVAKLSGNGIALDEFKLTSLDTLTEDMNMRMGLAGLRQEHESLWEKAEIEAKKYKLLKEKAELTKSLYGDDNVMTKMANSDVDASHEIIKQSVFS